jgi:aldehyde:ferredoxin oxidoreductase
MCHVMSSCGNCLFAYTSHPTAYIPEFLTAITGRHHDFDSCVTIGERIENMRHLFNLREGYNPLTITVNQRSLGRPPLEKGATAGITIDEEALIDEYCAAMSWDRTTAAPSQDKLEELGLRELVAEHGEVSP